MIYGLPHLVASRVEENRQKVILSCPGRVVLRLMPLHIVGVGLNQSRMERTASWRTWTGSRCAGER